MSWLAAAATGLNTLTSYLGAKEASNSAKSVNRRQIDFQSAVNAQSMDFQKNRYQYTMQDMKKAGLNPMLAFSQGASTAPQMSGTQLHNPGPSIQAAYTGMGANLSAGLNSAASMKQAETAEAVGHANIAIAQEKILNLATDRGLTYAQTHKVNQEVSNLLQQLNLTAEQSALAFSQTKQTNAKTKALLLSNEQKSILTRFYSSNEYALIAKDLDILSIIRSILPGLTGFLKKPTTFNTNHHHYQQRGR